MLIPTQKPNPQRKRGLDNNPDIRRDMVPEPVEGLDQRVDTLDHRAFP